MRHMAEQLAAAILAAGGVDEVARAAGAPCKALVDLVGQPMVAWVATAVRAAEVIGDFVVVEGPAGELSAGWQQSWARVVRAEGPGFLDTVRAAVAALPTAERILLVTTDLPLVTAAELDDFGRSCLATQAELSYAIISADSFERQFPGRGKTVARLREGRFTGGSVACVSRRFVVEQGEAIARTFERRKSKLALAALFGWGFIARLLAGRLSLADLERRGSQMLGCRLVALPTEHAGLAFDVDDPGDLELARQFLAQRQSR